MTVALMDVVSIKFNIGNFTQQLIEIVYPQLTWLERFIIFEEQMARRESSTSSIGH